MNLTPLFIPLADFWTTKCTQCPDALDKLDIMAQDPKYKDVQFISICCDKLDGARDIIEQEDDLRWQNVKHYFMDKDDKEKAKKILGFNPKFKINDGISQAVKWYLKGKI